MKETLSSDGAGRSERMITGLVRLCCALLVASAQAFVTVRVPGLVALAAASALALANLRAADSTTSAGAPDGTLLGENGDLDRIEFEGLKTFTHEALVKALAGQTRFLLVSHPQAPRAEFLETLRQKVLAGYQHSGFPNASVNTGLDSASGRVRVQVSEGNRFRCGQVQVTGAKPGPAAAIRARLTKPPLLPPKSAEEVPSTGKSSNAGDDESATAGVRTEVHVNFERREPHQALAATRKASDDTPLWMAGEPAAFGDAAAREIEEAVKDCLAEYGLFFPTTSSSVKLNPATGTADLVVRVIDEGPQGKVSELEVTGNQKNTREEILRFLGLKRGMAITRSRVVEAEQKLWRSARFLHYEITPEPATSGLTKATNVRLTVKVREYDAAPKLTERLSAEQQAMLRLCDWLSDFASRPEDLKISLAFTGTDDPFRRAVDLVVSPSQGALLMLKDQTNSSSTDYAVLFARKTLGLYAPKRGSKLFVSRPNLSSRAMISIAPGGDNPKEPFQFGMGGGFEGQSDPKLGTKPPFRLELTLAPAAFLHLLDTTNLQVQTKGKTLALVSSNQVVRVDAATGRLKELSVRDENMFIEVRFAKGAFDQARRELDAATSGLSNRYDPDHPFSSVVGFAAAELARWGMLDKVVTNLPPVQRERVVLAVNKLLGPTVLAPIDQAMSTDKPTEAFSIPMDETDRALAQNSLSAFFAAFGFRYCNEFFPKYSWPWTVARESVFVLAQQATYTDAELTRLYESDDTGPLGCLVIAELLTRVNSPAARTFAGRGLTRLSAAGFRNDCRLFLEGKSGLARVFANMTIALREMPPEEVEALAAALPTDEAGFLKDCAHALRAAPAQPLPESLGPALDKYWDKSLRAQIEAALLKLSVAARAPAGPRV